VGCKKFQERYSNCIGSSGDPACDPLHVAFAKSPCSARWYLVTLPHLSSQTRREFRDTISNHTGTEASSGYPRAVTPSPNRSFCISSGIPNGSAIILSQQTISCFRQKDDVLLYQPQRESRTSGDRFCHHASPRLPG